MCFGGGGNQPRTPKAPTLTPSAPPPPPAPTPIAPPQPLQQPQSAGPKLMIGGSRRGDASRQRRGASAVASGAPNVGGTGSGVNV